MLRRRTLIKGLLATVATPALAQNSFLTPGGSSVPGIVTMCLSSNVAVPCATGGGGSFPPNISGTQATIAADFAGQQYWSGGATQASFAAWLTAIGGTYTRASSATYLQGGVVKTATANTPRFPTDAGGVPQGIRLTGPATNLILQSSTLSAAAWNPLTTTIASAGTGPDGSTAAWSVIPSTGAAQHGAYQPTAGGFAAGSITGSAFLKAAGYNFGGVAVIDGGNNRYSAVFDLTTGAVTANGTVGTPTGTSAGSILLANGWVLCWVTVATTAGSGYLELVNSNVAVPTFTGEFPVFAGDGVSGMLAWGAQFTNTGFLCDYIPTTTVSVTQAADGLSFPFVQATLSTLAYTNSIVTDPSQMVVVGTDLSTVGAPIMTSSAMNGFANFSPSGGTLGGNVVAGGLGALHKTMTAGGPAARWIGSDGGTPSTLANALFSGAPVSINLGNLGGANNLYGNLGYFALWPNLVAPVPEIVRLTT